MVFWALYNCNITTNHIHEKENKDYNNTSNGGGDGTSGNSAQIKPSGLQSKIPRVSD